MAGGKKVIKRKTSASNIRKIEELSNESKLLLIKTNTGCSNNLTSSPILKQNITTVNKEDFILSEPPIIEQIDNSKSENDLATTGKSYSCSICDFQTCFYNLLANHQRRHSIRQPWACSRCSFSCKSKHSLLRHVRLVHEKPKKISCLDCDFKCSKQIELKNHMVVHSGKKYFQCGDCDFKSFKPANVRRHSVKHLKDKSQHICSVCGYRGVKPEYLKRHMEKHHGFEIHFNNSLCISDTSKENVDINSVRVASSHLVKIIKKQPVVMLSRCDDDINGACNNERNMGSIHKQILQDSFFDFAKCGEPEEIIGPELQNSFYEQDDVVLESTLITKSKNTITSIVKVVENDKFNQPHLLLRKSANGMKDNKAIKHLMSKQCTSLLQTGSNKVAINEVIYNKTNSNYKLDEIYKCKECDFVSTWIDKFETHVRLHGVTSFSCDKCNFMTSHQPSLARHKKLKHNLTKDFKCEECGYECASAQYLQCHIKRHVKTKRIKCKKCNTSFKSAASLKQHMNIHDRKKPFACDLCDFRTKSKISLRNHRFVHTGETKHICEICNYKFYSNYCLKKHMEVHGQS